MEMKGETSKMFFRRKFDVCALKSKQEKIEEEG